MPRSRGSGIGCLIALLVVAGAGYGSWRYFRSDPKGDAAPAGKVDAPAIHAPPDAGAGAPPPAAVAPAPPKPEPAPQPTTDPDVRAAVHALATGTAIGEQEKAVRARAESGDPAARAVLAASGADATARWLALTDLHQREIAPPEDRAAMLAAVVRAARDSLQTGTGALKYTVAKGDSLDKISKKVKAEHSVLVTSGMIRFANGMSNDRIHPDQVLVVPTDPLTLRISKSRFLLRAYLGKGLVREYGVAIGKEGKTPAATFTVDSKLVKPPWVDPVSGKRLLFGEPGYALGTRWLGFADNGVWHGLGIHGTSEPESIGKMASLGCIRLRNEEVEELFELVPVGCTVEILD